MNPPKPAARPERVSLWRYMRLFRQDILSAQPAKLYRAWMAEFRTPFFRSYLCNDPDLVARILKERPADFPKSDRIREGLAPLLGRSVFVTNGAEWERQRRLIDSAFDGGRLKDLFPAMLAAAQACRSRLQSAGQPVEIESAMAHATADVIFRALFSVAIEDETAARVFRAFQAYQRAQPLLNAGSLLPLPGWLPRFHRPGVRRAAREIRNLLREITRRRVEEMRQGRAPDDLATRILAARDPRTGQGFDADEMADQVAIFFLAGHETSASALAWSLYLLASHPEIQDRAAAEAAALPDRPAFADIAGLSVLRDVFRETLRLYPPVPMMVRESRHPEVLRDRLVAPGAQLVVSPWHLHRHERIWSDPDAFRPDRWREPQTAGAIRSAYLPFSAGPRICPGAGFATIEALVILAVLLRSFRLEASPDSVPEPVAHLTVRARNGIKLFLRLR
jgi:cytochrome P450